MTDKDGASHHPDDERDVLVYIDVPCVGGVVGVKVGYFDQDKSHWRVAGQQARGVTHWMELPDPPEDE